MSLTTWNVGIINIFLHLYCYNTQAYDKHSLSSFIAWNTRLLLPHRFFWASNYQMIFIYTFFLIFFFCFFETKNCFSFYKYDRYRGEFMFLFLLRSWLLFSFLFGWNMLQCLMIFFHHQISDIFFSFYSRGKKKLFFFMLLLVKCTVKAGTTFENACFYCPCLVNFCMHAVTNVAYDNIQLVFKLAPRIFTFCSCFSCFYFRKFFMTMICNHCLSRKWYF